MEISDFPETKYRKLPLKVKSSPTVMKCSNNKKNFGNRQRKDEDQSFLPLNLLRI